MNITQDIVATLDDPGDENFPKFMKKVTHRTIKDLQENEYDKHDYR